jgi:hypothetical protein
MLDWRYADAHLALAEIYEASRNPELATLHLREALSHKVLYTSHAPYAVRRVLILKAPSGFPANASLEFCVDHNRTDVDVLAEPT